MSSSADRPATHRRRLAPGAAHLIHGYIGVGKTTFARELERSTDGLRFSTDELVLALFGRPESQAGLDVVYPRVFALVDGLWPKIALAGVDVILDSGFWRRASRDRARSTAASFGVPVKLYNVTCRDEIARDRYRELNRKLEDGQFHVSDEMFTDLRSRFEPLDPDEPFTLIETG